MSITGSNREYDYGVYSPTTDLIYQALQALNEAEASEATVKEVSKDGVAPKGKLPGLGRHVGYFKKNEMLPEMLRVYEKGVRGPHLENYGLIKEAAKRELQRDDISLPNRIKLLGAIDKIDAKLLGISEQFYANHPIEKFKTDQEGIEKILSEQKSLIEANIKLNARETKKFEAQLKQTEAEMAHLEEAIERLTERKENGQSIDESKLIELKAELADLEPKLKKIKRSCSLLKNRGEALVERLNIVLGDIAKATGEIQKKLEPSAFLAFVGSQVSDSVLESPAEKLLDLTGAYDVSPKEGKGAVTNLGVAILAAGRDLIVAKSANRWAVFKKKVVQILPLAALAAGITAIYTVGPAIIAALGVALSAAADLFILTAGLIGVANPIGAVALGIVASGVILYGVGLLLSRNKAYIVKVFTPIASGLSYLAKGLVNLYKMIKEKISPDIHVSFKGREFTENNDEMRVQLRNIAANAKDNVRKAKLNKEIHGLQKQNRLKHAHTIKKLAIKAAAIDQKIRHRNCVIPAKKILNEIKEMLSTLNISSNEALKKPEYKAILKEKALKIEDLVGREEANKLLEGILVLR